MKAATVLVAAGIISAAAALGGSLAVAIRSAATPPPPAVPLSVSPPKPAVAQPQPVPPGPGIPSGVYPLGPLTRVSDPCTGEYFWQGVAANGVRHVPVFPRFGHLSGASFLGSDGLTYYQTCYDQ